MIMIISHGKLVACDTPENLSRSMEGTTTLELCIQDKEEKAEQLIKKHFGSRVVIESKLWLKETGQEEKNSQEIGIEDTAKAGEKNAEESTAGMEHGEENTEENTENTSVPETGKEKTKTDGDKINPEEGKEIEKGVWKGTIKTEGADDIREELFYLLADAKCPILEMKQSKLSLEDIFLELTEGTDVQKENIANKEEKEEVIDESSL